MSKFSLKRKSVALCFAWLFHPVIVSAQPEASSQEQATMATASATIASAFPEDPKRQIWFRHLKPLPADIRTAGLHIEVADSPRMSDRLTALFTEAGYRMVSADQAVYRYVLQGTFQSEGKVKLTVPLGKPLESAATGTGSDATAAKQLGDVAVAAVLADQVVKAGLSSPLWASGDLVRAVFDATGIRDALNTFLTGDRRGVCLGNCPYWEWSDQRVGLGWRDPRVKGIQSLSSVDVGLFAEGLFIEELTTLALNEFLRHHGVVQAPEPDTDSLMPHQKVLEVLKGRVRATISMLEK